MRTGAKTPLAILSALAILAGCRLSPQKAGFLRTDRDAVQFIQWTQEGAQIKGTFEMLKRKPDNEIETTSAMFDGVLDGENVSLTAKSAQTSQGGNKEPEEKITGKLKGDTLMFFPENGTEHEVAPMEFRRAKPTEYAEASRNLQMRAKLNKGAY